MESTLTAFDGAFLRLPATGTKITKPRPRSRRARSPPTCSRSMRSGRPASSTTSRSSRCSATSTSSTTGRCRSPTSARSPRWRATPGWWASSSTTRAWSAFARNYPVRPQVRRPHDRGLPRPDAARSAARSCRRSSPSSRTRWSSSCAAPPAPTPPRRQPRQPRVRLRRQLLGPFFAGFVEGKGARSLLVDGGTDYGLRTAEQFSRRRRRGARPASPRSRPTASSSPIRCAPSGRRRSTSRSACASSTARAATCCRTCRCCSPTRWCSRCAPPTPSSGRRSTSPT